MQLDVGKEFEEAQSHFEIAVSTGVTDPLDTVTRVLLMRNVWKNRSRQCPMENIIAH